MASFRRIQNSDHPNVGFTEAEIRLLEKQLQLQFNPTLIQFLQTAGVYMNVLDGNRVNIEILLFWNQQINHLKNFPFDVVQQPFCFFSMEKKNENGTSYYLPKNTVETLVYYYFVDLSKKELPVYSFSESEHFIEPQPGYVTVAPIGLQYVSPSLIQFINRETEKKYGETTGKKIVNIIGLFVFSPLLILLILYLIIQPNSNWRSTLFFWKKAK